MHPSHGQFASMPQPAIPLTNPLHTSWKNPDFPASYLTAENALDYFMNPSNSQFYDPMCVNQQLRMQGRMCTPELMRQAPGIQYELVRVQPPLFVIRKVVRHQPMADVEPLAEYYMIEGTVYQSPDIASIMNTRLANALMPLQDAMGMIRSFTKHSVSKGFYFETSTTAEAKTIAKKKKPEEVPKNWYHINRTQPVIEAWMKENFTDPQEEADKVAAASENGDSNSVRGVHHVADDASSVATSVATSVRPSGEPSASTTRIAHTR